MGFPHSSVSKESVYNAGDLDLIPGLGRSPGEGDGNPLQCSCLENPHGQRSLAGYGPWGSQESDMTQQLNHHHQVILDYLSGPKVFTRILLRERGSQDYERSCGSRGCNDGIASFEKGVLGAKAAGKGWNRLSPRSSGRRQPCIHHVGWLLRLTVNFCLQNCVGIHLCGVKPWSL